MNHYDFVHKKFHANGWESEMRAYIENLSVPSGSIWYKENRDLKKASEELITLGFYVKYKYGFADFIEFHLNPCQHDVDGWILQDGKPIEAVQIVIAYYENKEAKQDELTMSGKKCCFGGWKADRLEIMATRIKQRINKKVGKNYTGIDTLVVGVKGWFVISALEKEYSYIQKELASKADAILAASQFKELAIVDTDLVGIGGAWLFSNKSNRTPI